VVIPTMRREENGVRGPAPARFHVGEGDGVSFEFSVSSFELSAARVGSSA
jgi:hypothetical protein